MIKTLDFRKFLSTAALGVGVAILLLWGSANQKKVDLTVEKLK